MTREEKVNTLKAIIQECEEYQWQRRETLFEIIKDLEQEPILDKIKAEIEALPKVYPFVDHIDTYVKEDDTRKIIDKYKKVRNKDEKDI